MAHDYDDTYLAYTGSDGRTRVINAFTCKTTYNMNTASAYGGEGSIPPFTSVRWRPMISQDQKPQLVTTSADGSVHWWHLTL